MIIFQIPKKKIMKVLNLKAMMSQMVRKSKVQSVNR